VTDEVLSAQENALPLPSSFLPVSKTVEKPPTAVDLAVIPQATQIVAASEHDPLVQYLHELFAILYFEDKAQTFSMNVNCYNAAKGLQEKLNKKGWKVKRKMMAWKIPAGEL
jgi:hypothetical protein